MTDTEPLPTPTEFIEYKLHGGEPAWCVDGRPDFSHPNGAQMLGGSLHPILLSAIWENRDFDDQIVENKFQALGEAGFTQGVHRGDHGGCGFANNMSTILTTAADRRDEITRRLMQVYKSDQEKFGNTSRPFAALLRDTFERIESYQTSRLKLTGEPLIAMTEMMGAVVEHVQGNHNETVVFVNTNRDTTFDTNAANQQGKQAFNLDLWAAVDQATALGVDAEFATAASLILYQATEMVLVENRGKPALPVKIN